MAWLYCHFDISGYRVEELSQDYHTWRDLNLDDVMMMMLPVCYLNSVFEGYDGGSSDSECESPTLDEQECQSALMPDFWLIVKIYQDRVKVYSHSRSAKP